jgi:ABC-type polysaccharide/polyol phosphate export permease
MKSRMTLLLYFIKKDLKAKYAGSGLGIAWTFLMPVIQITLFWFVFSVIMRARPYATADMPYIFFLLSSFFFWLAFSEGLVRASNAIVENGEMVKKVSFPNALLPITVTLSSYIHHIVGFFLFLLAFSVVRRITPAFALIIPLLALQIVFSLGLGMILSALLPYLRDLSQVVGALMQGLFFVSPIMYSIEAVPEQYRFLFYINPFTYFASSYQSIILWNEFPPLSHLGIIVVLPVISLAAGIYGFRRLKDGFADVL